MIPITIFRLIIIAREIIFINFTFKRSWPMLNRRSQSVKTKNALNNDHITDIPYNNNNYYHSLDFRRRDALLTITNIFHAVLSSRSGHRPQNDLIVSRRLWFLSPWFWYLCAREGAVKTYYIIVNGDTAIRYYYYIFIFHYCNIV